jgi:hypothetical protein
MNKQTARIENWIKIENSGTGFLAGTVVDHPRQAEFTTDLQYTSPIVLFDEAAGVCETRNTRYILGKKRDTQ